MARNCRNIIRVFEGFAGYGGASFAMKRLNKRLPHIEFKVIGYSEINQSAIDLYNANHFNAKKNKPLNKFAATRHTQNSMPSNMNDTDTVLLFFFISPVFYVVF